MTIRTSPDGLARIRKREALRLKAYRDGGGVPTIGYGHTAGVKMGQTITEAQANDMLVQDVAEAERTILTFFPMDSARKLPQSAWDALVSFTFNLGAQAFQNRGTHSPTGIAKALRGEQWHEVGAQMLRWVYDNGQRVQGLANRRAEESALWLRDLA